MDTILTPCGRIRGAKSNMEGVVAYKGIRYATAERWAYPQVVKHWEGVYEADHYGNCSYQPRAFYDEENVPEKYFYYNEFRKGETYTYDEDCLFLNIWVPEDAKAGDGLPVLFYIHGGGFTGGCGHEKHFDGPRWAQHGVIAVTVNYRLGPMGFLCLPQLADEAGHTGNYGLYDQMAAMQWIRENIASFGGDPDKITIMGQSAGAMSVQCHCVSPITDGLFRSAVMSSGGGVSKLMNYTARPEKRYPFWQQVMDQCGARTVDEFRKVAPAKLFDIWQKLKKELKAGMIASPCIDGVMLTESALSAAEAGRQKDIPYMLGSTSEDMAPPIIFDMALSWCALQHKQGKQPSYCWYFDRKLPGDDCGAWHSSDLWYWFGTLDNGWRPWEEKDWDVSGQMVRYLTNFVKNGDPNGEGLAQWKAVDGKNAKALRLGQGETRMGRPNKLKQFHTMLTNQAVGE